MALSQLVIHAALHGFAEALGVSGAAHALALGLWVAPPEAGVAAVAAGGAGAAVVVALRGRLWPAFGEAVRALPQPAAFAASSRAREVVAAVWIAAVSGVLGVVLRRAGAAPSPAPRTVAIGLGVTGLALLGGAYLSAARGEAKGRAQARGGRGVHEVPTLVGATLAGAAHAFGVWPGVSRVGVAAAVLLALGIRPVRAIEAALVATVPFFLVDLGTGLSASPAPGKAQALAAVLFAFLGGLGAIAALRALVARRALAALALWTLPLACAIFVYGRAAQVP